MFLLLLQKAVFFPPILVNMLEHFGLDACGMDWDLKPQKAIDGSHHHLDTLGRFNVHAVASDQRL